MQRADGSLPPASYFCEGCENDERAALQVQSVLRELELLIGAGAEMEAAVAQLKAAHALRPDPGSKVNVHLHAALDGHVLASVGGGGERRSEQTGQARIQVAASRGKCGAT